MQNTLDEHLRAEALTLGADYFGVADLSPAQEFIREQGGEMVAAFPCAVSVGVLMPSAHAFTGRNFRADEPREMRFDVHKCNAYMREREEQMGVRVCGLCVYVCPYGRGCLTSSYKRL